jgi:hypothetical protein
MGQRTKRETGAHACGREARCEEKGRGTRVAAGRLGEQDAAPSALTTHRRGERGPQAEDQTRSGRGPGKGVLADTRWGDGGRVHGALQMLEEFPDHLALRDGRDDAQRPLLAGDKNFKRHFRLAAPAVRHSRLQPGVTRQCAAWTGG